MGQMQKHQGGGELQQLRAHLEKEREAVASLLPKHVDAGKLEQAVIRTPGITKCAPDTVMAAVMDCAQLGLIPGLFGQAYLIPRYNKDRRGYVADLMIGYRGLMDLVRRSGEVKVLEAHVVYENDRYFNRITVSETEFWHEPTLFGARGKMIGVYAIARLANGEGLIEAMDVQAIAQVRACAQSDNVWSKWPLEMAKKVVIRRLIKRLPLSVDVMEAVIGDDRRWYEFDRKKRNEARAAERENPPIIEGEVVEGGVTNAAKKEAPKKQQAPAAAKGQATPDVIRQTALRAKFPEADADALAGLFQAATERGNGVGRIAVDLCRDACVAGYSEDLRDRLVDVADAVADPKITAPELEKMAAVIDIRDMAEMVREERRQAAEERDAIQNAEATQ